MVVGIRLELYCSNKIVLNREGGGEGKGEREGGGGGRRPIYLQKGEKGEANDDRCWVNLDVRSNLIN